MNKPLLKVVQYGALFGFLKVGLYLQDYRKAIQTLFCIAKVISGRIDWRNIKL